jgi:hypothetical protein
VIFRKGGEGKPIVKEIKAAKVLLRLEDWPGLALKKIISSGRFVIVIPVIILPLQFLLKTSHNENHFPQTATA